MLVVIICSLTVHRPADHREKPFAGLARNLADSPAARTAGKPEIVTIVEFVCKALRTQMSEVAVLPHLGDDGPSPEGRCLFLGLLCRV